LVAWWDGTNWRKNNDSGSAIVTDAEFKAWQADKLYAIDDIEDVLNLGINYIVKVGDGIGNITIRIIPVVADTQVAPSYIGTTPTPLVVPTAAPATSSSSGGGCTTATGQAPFDPMLPLLAALGVIGLGVRRLRRH
ncbi:MAG: JDVT-CTERM domain-containing protein, partial [Rhodoferax sp.]|nr:JDVT-CTERM domain-containing protein [Rhodoferax sp.]